MYDDEARLSTVPSRSGCHRYLSIPHLQAQIKTGPNGTQSSIFR
jgi:hypothetical protein